MKIGTEVITAALKAFTAWQEMNQKTYERDTLIKFRAEERAAWQHWIDEIASTPNPTRVERARLNALHNDFLFYRKIRETAQANFSLAGK